MSLQSDVRDRIAAACSLDVQVDGVTYPVTGRAVPPGTISPLDAWPIWQRTAFLSSCVREITWFVTVALPPADPETYIDLADAFTDAVGDSLMRVGRIVAVTPVQIAASDANAPLPCLQFEVQT